MFVSPNDILGVVLLGFAVWSAALLMEYFFSDDDED